MNLWLSLNISHENQFVVNRGFECNLMQLEFAAAFVYVNIQGFIYKIEGLGVSE